MGRELKINDNNGADLCRIEPSTEVADAEQSERFLVGTAWIELLQQTVEHRAWRGHAGKERGG
jgi:hypothetical protein